MSNTYKTSEGKKFQVVLRKRDGRNGIVEKRFFEDEDAAQNYADLNSDKFLVDFRDLAYFKAA